MEKDSKSVGLEKEDTLNRADGEWELERLLLQQGSKLRLTSHQCEQKLSAGD